MVVCWLNLQTSTDYHILLDQLDNDFNELVVILLHVPGDCPTVWFWWGHTSAKAEVKQKFVGLSQWFQWAYAHPTTGTWWVENFIIIHTPDIHCNGFSST